MEDVFYALRHELNRNAEVSGEETNTKEILMAFLKKHTKHLEIVDCGDFFYAKHIENGSKPSIALRCDYDALPVIEGGAKHLCGHDGHATQMCYVACMLDEMEVDRNVFLIFQPEEETGQGAKKCCKIFDLEKIDYVFGMHNLPGFEEGVVYCIHDTFALASKGVTLSFVGKPTHAAYPELGVNPSEVVAKVLLKVQEWNAKETKQLTLCTVIGVHMGDRNFGKAAERAKVYLTMRAETDEDLEEMDRCIVGYAKDLATKEGLAFSVDVQDAFPSVINTNACVDWLLDFEHGKVLDEPMRWSEDFGHYLHYAKGCFFGVGAGVDHPGLHTECYDYNDAILEVSGKVFLDIVKNL